MFGNNFNLGFDSGGDCWFYSVLYSQSCSSNTSSNRMETCDFRKSDLNFCICMIFSVSTQNTNLSPDTRTVHFVGSLPFKKSEMLTTMRMLLNKLDGYLESMPDGEPPDDIVDRSSWVDTPLRYLNTHTNEFLLSEKEPESEDIQLVPLVQPSLLAEKLNGLSYEYTFNQSYQVFKEALRGRKPAAKTVFQVGVPSSFAISLVGFKSPFDKFKYMPSIRAALANEINSIAGIAGHENVLFQVEVPIETVLAFRAIGAALAHLVPTRVFYAELVELLKLLDSRVRVGVHICLG